MAAFHFCALNIGRSALLAFGTKLTEAASEPPQKTTSISYVSTLPDRERKKPDF